MNPVNEKIRKIIEKTREKLKEAEILFEEGLYSGAVCRAYYAVFHAACAVLIIKKLEFSKHSAVISAFGQQFVKTGELNENLHTIFKQAFEARQLADYDVFKKYQKNLRKTSNKKPENLLRKL
jgi:uncharacterized protein (UPF0332 family)